MKKTKTISRLILIVMLVAIVGCGNALGAEAPALSVDQLVIAAAAQGGDWYSIAVGYGEVFKKHLNLNFYSVTPGGGAANPSLVNMGEADLGISVAISVNEAHNGIESYTEKHDNMLMFATQFPQVVQAVVWADSNINSIEDLKGKKVAVGPKGATGEIVAQRVLEAYGMSYADLGSVSYVAFGDAISEMTDKRLDCCFSTLSMPYPGYTELNMSGQIRLLQISDEAISFVHNINPGYLSQVFEPNTTYDGIDYEWKTLVTPNAVVVRADMSEEDVYLLFKAYVEGMDEIKAAGPAMRPVVVGPMLVQDIGVPYHPGVIRYAKEQGWL